jgi:hypothetical protein
VPSKNTGTKIELSLAAIQLGLRYNFGIVEANQASYITGSELFVDGGQGQI